MDFSAAKQLMIQSYLAVRHKTEELCRPLATEDYVIQSTPDASPPKWHLAHTSWFFETFLLATELPGYQVFNSQFQFLFNSYYHGVGKPFPREQRGHLSRPKVEAVLDYREFVDKNLLIFMDQMSEEQFSRLKPIINLGLHHEQQHQELLLMDIKQNFSFDPSFPSYHAQPSQAPAASNPTQFIYVDGGIINIGATAQEFCFDNELPQHQHILPSFRIANQLVTNHEYCQFIADNGYNDARWWLDDGWFEIQKNQWQAPAYWHQQNNEWVIFTLSGLKLQDPNEPVSHISYYEADAYARWRGYRLPSEAEWEHFVNVTQANPSGSNFLETGRYHPQNAAQKNQPIAQQLFGDLWEWTSSPYSPYPGFKPHQGKLCEYNGKFMNNQMVLRGGSCVTPETHIRASYRNFFQPSKRWQFSGIRLASDIEKE